MEEEESPDEDKLESQDGDELAADMAVDVAINQKVTRG